MSFKSLRDRKLLSQERLAELSGLSLRTIQRAEAGHRVSYASLRALAATLEMDVDLLERELYAMNRSTDDFVEIPRWARLWTNAWWSTGPRPSRRQAHIAEALCIGSGIVFFVASFLVPHLIVTIFRVGAGFALVCGYLISLSIRIVDNYKLWPGNEISWREWRPVRTLRGTVIDYTFVLAALVAFFGLVFWLGD
jgi:transcriptional regulator with XRE-family HTH domain